MSKMWKNDCTKICGYNEMQELWMGKRKKIMQRNYSDLETARKKRNRSKRRQLAIRDGILISFTVLWFLLGLAFFVGIVVLVWVLISKLVGA